MAEESDGIEEALESTVRLSAMAGARLGSEIARAHEDRLREQRHIDEREADRLQRRLEAERYVSVPGSGDVRTPHPGERVSAAAPGEERWNELREAKEWAKSREPETWARYQDDVMGSDSAEGREAAERGLMRSWREAQARDSDAPSAAADRTFALEQAEAAMLVAAADREAELAYDSADRRQADVASMTAAGIDPQVAESRMHADTAAGRPVTAATAGGRHGQAPKARTTRGRG